jgi:hypothetical protein
VAHHLEDLVHPALGSVGMVNSPDIEVARLRFHLLYHDTESRGEILNQLPLK